MENAEKKENKATVVSSNSQNKEAKITPDTSKINNQNSVTQKQSLTTKKSNSNPASQSQKVVQKPTQKTSQKVVVEKNQNTTTQISKTTKEKTQQTKQKSDKKSEIEKVNEEIKKTKNEIELIGIFSKLEKNLVEVLQTIPKDVSEEGLDSEKANIKSYMEKVQLARKLFDEYENTARIITLLSESKENDQESIEISKKVMEIREGKSKTNIDEKELLRQVQAIEKQSKGLEKVEIETIGDTVIVKKKKLNSKEKA